MPTFDRSLVYQFGFFLGKIEKAQKELVPKLTEILKDEVSGSQLPITLDEPELATVIGTLPSGPQAKPIYVWQGGGGIWKVHFTNERLDLYFDAKGRAEIRGEMPSSLSEVGGRVIPNLRKAIDELGIIVTRPVLIQKGEANLKREEAVKLVVDRFFGPKFRESPMAEELFESTAKTTIRKEWRLSDDTKLPVNLIETGRAVWELRGGVGRHYLAWEFDINGAPEVSDQTHLTGAEFEIFSNLAIQWIEENQ